MVILAWPEAILDALLVFAVGVMTGRWWIHREAVAKGLLLRGFDDPPPHVSLVPDHVAPVVQLFDWQQEGA